MFQSRIDRPFSSHFLGQDRIPYSSDLASHSRQSSASTTSDSSPHTSTFSARNQGSAYSSPNSSADSFHHGHDDQASPCATHKRNMPRLPRLAEHPVDVQSHPSEHQLHPDELFAASFRRSNSRQGWAPAAFFASNIEYDMRDGFSSDSDQPSDYIVKRHKSNGPAAAKSFTQRLVTRFPSLSRQDRQQKRPADNDAAKVPTPASPATTLTRSASFARSLRTRSRRFSAAIQPQQTPVSISTISEDDVALPEDNVVEDPTEVGQSNMPDPLIRASTPLLPPLMVDLQDKAPIQSPLQSPTVAPLTAPSTPTPSVSGFQSPGLVSTPSLGNCQRAPANQTTPTSELPPILFADPNDEWAEKLGHANFSISPQPYMPERCTLSSCKKLLGDWETARAEYSKHLARTSTHFGPGSKIYKLTEQKWALIDARWRRNNELASSRAVKSGESPPGHTPIEPAPVTKMPTFDVSQAEGKFPKLGDDDIVGPMVQVASQSQLQLRRKPSKRAKFLSIIGLRSTRP